MNKELNNVAEKGIDFLPDTLTIYYLLHEIDFTFLVSFIFSCDCR